MHRWPTETVEKETRTMASGLVPVIPCSIAVCSRAIHRFQRGIIRIDDEQGSNRGRMIELKPETEQLVQEEIQRGHFHSVDELIVQSVNAWRERHQVSPATALPRKPRKNLADFLLESPFAGSDLQIERQRDYPRSVDLR